MATAKPPVQSNLENKIGNIWNAYQAGSKFFMKEGDVYETMRRLVSRLTEEGLDYALIGAMALVAHGYRRFTEDVDILLTKEGLQIFCDRLLGRGYISAFQGSTKIFRDAQTKVKIEIVTAGEFPGDGKPKPVVFPDPAEARQEKEGIWIITLEKLIELKLASGLSAPHRLKDLADVQELIMRLKLPQNLANQLSSSVRDEYLRLWRIAQSAPPDI